MTESERGKVWKGEEKKDDKGIIMRLLREYNFRKSCVPFMEVVVGFVQQQQGF